MALDLGKNKKKPPADPWAGLRTATVDPVQTAAVEPVVNAPSAAPDYGYVQPPANTSGFGGFMDQLKYINQVNPGAFTQLGAGIMANDVAGGIAGAGQELQQGQVLQQRAKEKLFGYQEEQKSKNLTRQWLLSQGFDAATADAAMANPEILQQLLAAPKEDTNDWQNYQHALAGGYQGTFNDYQLQKIRAGVATPPAPPMEGYRIVKQPDESWAYEKIPIVGGDPKEEVKKGQQDVVTETITSTAQKARVAAKGRLTGALFQDWMAQWPTQAREVQNYVDTLKSNASAEAIAQQRAAVGATGTVSDKDLAVAAAKAGALDPSSLNFEADLDDYERTLLRLIHGPDRGEQIFRSTRKVDEGAKYPTVNSQADFDALPSGQRYINGKTGKPATKP